MGIYLRPARFVKLRLTRRGLRYGIGPRWLRIWGGAGGSGVSTGAGPVSYYRSLHRRRHPITGKRESYRGRLPDGWMCQHHHTRPDTAAACARREERRRRSAAGSD